MKESPSDYGWSIDYTRRIISKKFSLFEWFLAVFHIQRTSVEEFYRLFQQEFLSSEVGILLEDILERDSFEKPENYPRSYRLKNGWSIEKSSLLFLKAGPLFTENAQKILVKESNIWKPIALISFLIGISGISILEPISLENLLRNLISN